VIARRLGILLLIASWIGALAVPALAAEASADTASGASGWVERTLKSYFGSSSTLGEELDGQTLDIVDHYLAWEGQPIAAVLVEQTARFSEQALASEDQVQQVLNAAVKPFRPRTRERTIRDFLLFEAGDTFDPFLLADSERLLRRLDYIEDVRISVMASTTVPGAVVILVETRDRWPYGVTGTVKDVGRYEVNLYSTNVGGTGTRWENRLIYRQDREPVKGYEGLLFKKNVGGTFVDATLRYEDSYRKLHKGLELSRDLIFPSIDWVGGASWRRTDERDAGPDPDDSETKDLWFGKVVPLNANRPSEETARPVLVPGVSLSSVHYFQRPDVGPDIRPSFHHRRNYLVGLSYQRLVHYRTNFLFGMGETENLPAGVTLQISGGYEDGEYNGRAQANAQAGSIRVRNDGSILMGRAGFGGFFRSGEFEDGRLLLALAAVSRPWGALPWRSRGYARISFLRALDQSSDTVLMLGNRTKLRGLADDEVTGSQRLLGNFEYHLFTPWALMGFHCMVSSFLDVGAVAGQNGNIWQQKFYTGWGVGVRIENPDLVFPALQVRLGVANRVEGHGITISFNVGNPEVPTNHMPGIRPGGFAFE